MDRYAVVGNPVSHSLSPRIHALFARQENEALEYTRIEAPVDGFAMTVRSFFAAGGRGVNVTLPFKLEALRFATSASERASAAGAANFLASRGDRIEADNTDGAGLVNDLTRNLGFALRGASILLVGAGGAARGVISPLLAERPARLVVANRTPARAQELSERFARLGAIEAAALEDLARERFDLVLNATSTSVHGEALPIADAVLAGARLAYDMAYGPAAERFMARASGAGARSSDGLGMLVEQAAESFQLWRGKRPDTKAVLAELRSSRA